MTGTANVSTNEGTTTQEAGLPCNGCRTGTALPEAKKLAAKAFKEFEAGTPPAFAVAIAKVMLELGRIQEVSRWPWPPGPFA